MKTIDDYIQLKTQGSSVQLCNWNLIMQDILFYLIFISPVTYFTITVINNFTDEIGHFTWHYRAPSHIYIMLIKSMKYLIDILTLWYAPLRISIQQSTIPVDKGTETTSNISTTKGLKITFFCWFGLATAEAQVSLRAVSQISCGRPKKYKIFIFRGIYS